MMSDITRQPPSATAIDSREYLEVIDQICSYFARKWQLDAMEKDDLFQDIYLSFKERQMQIVIDYYNPKAGSFEDYFRRAVFNKCREWLRRKNRHSKIALLDPSQAVTSWQSSGENPEKKAIAREVVQRECFKVDMFTKLLSKHRERLLLLLKLYARIVIKINDLQAYHLKLKKRLIRNALLIFGIAYAPLQDQEVMEGIFPVIKAREPEINQVTSLRRWLDRQINKLTDYLNNNGELTYESNSLRNLLGIYFNSQKQVEKEAPAGVG